MGCVCMSNITMMELSRELDEQFDRLVNECRVSGEINQELYTEYDVKRGLRDANGKGVLTGLTEISDVLSYKSVNGKKMPALTADSVKKSVVSMRLPSKTAK